MKLPAVWIAAGFAGGIALAGSAGAVGPRVWPALVVAALLAGFALLPRNHATAAWIAGLFAWVFLGTFAAQMERLAVPPNHITKLLAEDTEDPRPGKIDTSEALRWRGRLRSDPVRLPWGSRYEIELEEVEVAGAPQAIRGGMRLNYYRNDRAPEVQPALRAGDRIEVLARARPVRNFQNPGAFDARTHFARQEIHLTGTLRSTELLSRIGEPAPTFRQRMARIRGRLLGKVDELFAGRPEQSAVLRAMLLGDYSFIDHDVAEAFQKTSVLHVLVISGMHVAALAVFVFWVGRGLRFSPGAITLATLLVLASYIAVVEDQPPIERAAVMSVAFLLSGLLFRRVELLNTIAVAALLILVARPAALADPSFQLSFLAGAMIGALAAPWLERTSVPYRRALRHLGDVTRDAGHAPRVAQLRLDLRATSQWLAARLPRLLAPRAGGLVTAPCSAALLLWEVFLISTTIQLGMMPVLAHYFHRVSLSGPLANIPAAVLSGLIVPIGMVTLGLGVLWNAAGAAVAKLLGWLVAALLTCVTWISGWQWGAYRIPGPPVWLLMAFFAVLVLMAASARKRDAMLSRRWQLALALPLAAPAFAVATYPFAPHLEAGKLEMTALDVGQGDSLFVAFPDGRTLLVDGGGIIGLFRREGARTGLDIGEQVVSPYLWARGLKRIDVVALTHAHQDHMDGLTAVLKNFQVGELWVGGDVDTPAYRVLLEIAAASGVRVVHRKHGEVFSWGGAGGVVLWPEDTAPVPNARNNDSLVLRLQFGETAYLLPGDIEQGVERALLAQREPLTAGVLKVAHHGSKTSTTDDFLAAVGPRVAVISVSRDNTFGHPYPDVMERLRSAGVRVLRTDRDGAVTALSDGRTLRMSTFREAVDSRK